MRILIVDDEIRVAMVLAESVRFQGHEAIVAGSGEEGLALLDQTHPHAVFLDLVMPGMSGLEVLRRIRQSHPALPVVVLTGHASSAQIDEAKRLGATDCITKPFVLNQLNRALGSLRPESA
jgi:CheY-like chemotaxis protein